MSPARFRCATLLRLFLVIWRVENIYNALYEAPKTRYTTQHIKQSLLARLTSCLGLYDWLVTAHTGLIVYPGPALSDEYLLTLSRNLESSRLDFIIWNSAGRTSVEPLAARYSFEQL